MRALRIHHEKRIKARVRREFWSFYHVSDEHKARVCGILAKTHARCSCYMCGNPRKYDGKRTLKELVQIFDLKERIDE